MITRTDYNKALNIVEAYHVQTDKDVERRKTTINDWVAKANCSSKVCNALYRLRHKIEYIEDVKESDFLSVHYVGVKTWREFRDVRGFD